MSGVRGQNGKTGWSPQKDNLRRWCSDSHCSLTAKRLWAWFLTSLWDACIFSLCLLCALQVLLFLPHYNNILVNESNIFQSYTAPNGELQENITQKLSSFLYVVKLCAQDATCWQMNSQIPHLLCAETDSHWGTVVLEATRQLRVHFLHMQVRVLSFCFSSCWQLKHKTHFTLGLSMYCVFLAVVF